MNDEQKLAALISAIGELRQKSMELCWKIEECGASKELTEASIMASNLNSQINNLLK